MKTLASFGLLILVASMVLGGMTSNVSAQDDPAILLKIAKYAQEQIRNQMSIDSSDEAKRLFEEGTLQVDALEESLVNDDVDSAREYFLSAMKIFTETSRQLTTINATPNDETDSLQSDIKDPSNDFERLQAYVATLKTIAQKHNASIDFSEIDELSAQARQQIDDYQFSFASETIHEIKQSIMKLNKELREEASKQESQRAKEYAQKYLEQLDRLIENAKKQSVDDEIIQKLETAKQNLSSADNPSEIIQEIRKILSIKEKFELTNNDGFESRVLKVEQTLSRLSQTDGIDTDDLADSKNALQNVKRHLYESEFDAASDLLESLVNQLEEIKNSI